MRRLRAALGGDDRIVEASAATIVSTAGIGRAAAEAIRRAVDEADPTAEREAMHTVGASMVLAGDADYPPLLAAVDDAPMALWSRGRLEPVAAPTLAIVGSRRCSPYGRDLAGRMGSRLASAGLAIISGGAIGIDGEAHRGALRAGGRTIAVLGCGLGRCYPARHQRLFEQIVAEGGAVISELPVGAPPRAHNFPRRNRIISGLSLGVLVIDAGRGSGALITARLAAEDHGREVMVVPGRADTPTALGGLEAVRDGWAAIVVDHEDVLRQLGSSSRHLIRGALDAARSAGALDPVDACPPAPFELRDATASVVVAVLREARMALSIDQIAERGRLPIASLLAALTMLEISGSVQRRASLVQLRGGG
ncbi:MAG: DNA-processing protein DprA [Planctomycetota bacterium]